MGFSFNKKLTKIHIRCIKIKKIKLEKKQCSTNQIGAVRKLYQVICKRLVCLTIADTLLHFYCADLTFSQTHEFQKL